MFISSPKPQSPEQEAWGWAWTDKITSLSAGPGGRDGLLTAPGGGERGRAGGAAQEGGGTSLLRRRGPFRAPGSPAAPSPFLRTQEPCPGTLTPLSTPSLLRWNCPGCTPDPGGHAERRSHCERGRGPHGCGECPELGAEGARLTPVSLRKAKPKGCGTAKTPSPGSQDPSTRESGHPHLGVRTPQPGTVRTPLPGSGPLHPGVRTPQPGSQDPSTWDSWNPPTWESGPLHTGASGPLNLGSLEPPTRESGPLNLGHLGPPPPRRVRTLLPRPARTPPPGHPSPGVV